MMKKLFLVGAVTVILTGQSIFAQEADSEVQSSQREDSLLQVVNELSDRVQKTEDAARNERIWKKRAKYFNIGYITNQTLTDKVDAEAEWKSDFGVSLTFGKTYYLHKKPLLNMIKFGIDATWFELSYAKYSEPDVFAEGGSYTRAYNDYSSDYEDYYEEDFDLGIHQIDASMHVGPSVTVNPVGDLKVAAYFHYVPTYSMVVIDDSFGHGYVSNFAFGASVAYKAISVGIEHRWAKKATYNGLSFDEESMDYDAPDFEDVIESDKWKMKSKSFRVFLSFRY
jgi:hypothetical protein